MLTIHNKTELKTKLSVTKLNKSKSNSKIYTPHVYIYRIGKPFHIYTESAKNFKPTKNLVLVEKSNLKTKMT